MSDINNLSHPSSINNTATSSRELALFAECSGALRFCEQKRKWANRTQP